MKLNFYRLTPNNFLAPLPPDAPWPADDSHYWLDIEADNAEILQELLAPLHLPAQILAGCVGPAHSPQVILYQEALFMEFQAHNAGGHHLRPSHLALVCLSNLLVTIQKGPAQSITDVATELAGNIQLPAANVTALCYYLLDELIEQNILVAIEGRRELVKLSDKLDSAPHTVKPHHIIALRQRVRRLALVCEDQLYCVVFLRRTETILLGSSNSRDRVDDLEQALRLISHLETSVKELHDYYQLILQDKTQNKLRILTILSAIFLPLTLLTGIYGMNFKYMPILEWEHGYPTVLLTMGLITAGMLLFFYWRGWFK
jgi:magnesium transporter